MLEIHDHKYYLYKDKIYLFDLCVWSPHLCVGGWCLVVGALRSCDSLPFFLFLCMMAEPENKQAESKVKSYLKKVGLIGFLFFLIKGLLWLAFGYFLLK
ncbi:MAG: hypothetical protein IPP38_09415 [Bacteroidetes bacterium]|nr:hypothetical protein [Bacteroidota bacterium]